MSDRWRLVPGHTGYVAVDGAGRRRTPAALAQELLALAGAQAGTPPDSLPGRVTADQLAASRALLDALRAAEALRPRGDRA
jgi:hypothetical protein